MKDNGRRTLQAAAGAALGVAILGASSLVNAQTSWHTVIESIRAMLSEGTYWKLVANQTRVSADRQVETQKKSNQPTRSTSSASRNA